MAGIRVLLRALPVTALLVTQVVLLPPASAAPGDLDLSFGTGGKVITYVAGGEISDVAVQPDGKIVAAGDIGGHFGLARYNVDGSLDPMFDVDGLVTTPFGPCCDDATAVAIQSNGKIVAAGFTSQQDFALARYNADGSLDTSFDGDGDGTATTDFGGSDIANGVAIQPDGKIVAAGSTFSGGVLSFALARYNPDGSLDTTFDTDGRVTTDFGLSAVANDVAIQTDGKIVAAGFGPGLQFALVRYNPNGSLDSTFDGDGRAGTNFGSASFSSFAQGLAIQSNGKIVVAGEIQKPAWDFALARFNPDGSLDASFDTDGLVTTDFGSDFESANDVATQADGKVVAAGFSGSQFFGDFALARYEPNGTLDSSFGTDGEVITDFGSVFDGVNSVAIQADGKIVATGRSVSGVSLAFALTRYEGGVALTVPIDIKPGSSSNPIRLWSTGRIPVAILSTSSFDATTVDPLSVCFGDAETPVQRDCTESHSSLEDVNGDGRLDLLLLFQTRQTGIDPGDTRACLTGRTFSGVSVEGCDSIKTL
jgi:uncharacterized delta-60 repeat protein